MNGPTHARQVEDPRAYRVVVMTEDPAEIKDRAARYLTIASGLTLALIVAIATSAGLAYKIVHQKPALAAATNDLRLIPIKSLDRAIRSADTLEEFVRKALSRMYSMSFRSTDTALLDSRPFFCQAQYAALPTIMSKTYERVKKDRLVTSWTNTKGPTLVDTSGADGQLKTYILDGQGELRYEGRSEERYPLAVRFEVVQTDSIDDYPYGVCVKSFNFKPL